jgi:phosphate starvation-inducible protein PhoH
MQHEEIAKKIKGYGLTDDLKTRLGVVVKDGVSRNMIYKAFKYGPKTPLACVILDEAQNLIVQHMENVSDKLFQMEITAT